MVARRQGEDQAGVPERVRDTADSFVALVAAHFRVANLELVADLRARTGRFVVQLAIGLVALIGYVLLMVGVAVAIVPWVGRPWAFVAVGAFHLAAALVAAIVIGLRRQRVPQVRQLLASIGQSVSSVADAVAIAPPPVPASEQPRAGI
jgi:uncharacterized membrane protein YqjE